MVEKPDVRPKPGALVDVVDNTGVWVARGFYNGHSRITLRVLTENPDEAVDAGFFRARIAEAVCLRRESLRLDERSEEHTSELQSLMRISYAVFCLKKKTKYTKLKT